MAWPTEIRVAKDRRALTVVFDDGASFTHTAEYLRVTSPSAEVQGHSAAQRQTVGGKLNVQILGVEPVGNYAVRIRFDDTHDSGLFTFGYLHELGTRHDELWGRYLSEVEAKGLSREADGHSHHGHGHGHGHGHLH